MVIFQELHHSNELVDMNVRSFLNSNQSSDVIDDFADDSVEQVRRDNKKSPYKHVAERYLHIDFRAAHQCISYVKERYQRVIFDVNETSNHRNQQHERYDGRCNYATTGNSGFDYFDGFFE